MSASIEEGTWKGRKSSENDGPYAAERPSGSNLMGRKQEERMNVMTRPLDHSLQKRHSPTRRVQTTKIEGNGETILVGHHQCRQLGVRGAMISDQDQAGITTSISHGDPHGRCQQLNRSLVLSTPQTLSGGAGWGADGETIFPSGFAQKFLPQTTTGAMQFY